MKLGFPNVALLALHLAGLLSLCECVLPSYIAAIQDRGHSCILSFGYYLILELVKLGSIISFVAAVVINLLFLLLFFFRR